MTWTNSGLLVAPLQLLFQVAERREFAVLEFLDPPFVDLMDRRRADAEAKIIRTNKKSCTIAKL